MSGRQLLPAGHRPVAALLSAGQLLPRGQCHSAGMPGWKLLPRQCFLAQSVSGWLYGREQCQCHPGIYYSGVLTMSSGNSRDRSLASVMPALFWGLSVLRRRDERHSDQCDDAERPCVSTWVLLLRFCPCRNPVPRGNVPGDLWRKQRVAVPAVCGRYVPAVGRQQRVSPLW